MAAKHRVVWLVVGLGILAANAWAQVPALPGDRGRPMQGVMPATDGARPPPPAGNAPSAQHQKPAALPLDAAVRAAQAIDHTCQQYPLGVAIVDAAGVARLIYVPDRSEAWHGYSAVRKAYTAVIFEADTSKLIRKSQQDAEMAARIKADPNLQAFPGGLLLKSGGKIIGAIGVSGAEPGGHDEECALAGLTAIKDSLQAAR